MDRRSCITCHTQPSADGRGAVPSEAPRPRDSPEPHEVVEGVVGHRNALPEAGFLIEPEMNPSVDAALGLFVGQLAEAVVGADDIGIVLRTAPGDRETDVVAADEALQRA